MSFNITIVDKTLGKTTEAFATLIEFQPKPKLLAQVIRAELANIRISRAHAKTRSEVSGGGKKPWKQKGTGRARHGSSRSPIWVKGGVTHGPRNTTNWHQKINKSARLSSLKSILKDRLDHNCVFEIPAKAVFEKTQKAIEALSIIEKKTETPISKSILVYTTEQKPQLRGFTNSGIVLINAKNIKLYKLATSQNLILTEQAREILENRIK